MCPGGPPCPCLGPADVPCRAFRVSSWSPAMSLRSLVQHPHGPCRLPCPGDSSAGTASVVASRGAPRGLHSPCPASWALQPWSQVHSARHLFWERCPHLWPAAQPRTRGTSHLPWGQPLGHPRNPRMGLAPRCWCLPLVLVAPPCWRAAWGRGGPCVTLEGHLRNEGGEGGQKLALSLPPLPSGSPPSPLHPQILQIPSRPRAPSPRFSVDARNGASSPRRPPHPRLEAQILSLCWSLGCHTRNVTRAEFPPVSPWRLRCGRAAAAGIHPRGRTGRESRQRCRCPRLLPAVAFAVLSSPHTKPRSWHPDALQHAPKFKPLGCQIKPRVSYEPKIILGL